MSGEEVGPDFDIGIVGGNGVKSAWQSQSSSGEPSSHRENSMDTPDQLEQRVGRDTQHQLKRLLSLSEGSDTFTKSHERGRKRSRLSGSRSRTASRSREKGERKNSNTCPTKIVQIFDRDIIPKTIETPAAILELVQEATTEQICKMCKL